MREKLLWLCTCTGIEVMTASGVSLYLVYIGQITIALISAVIFAKLIGFHFAIEIHERLKRKKSCNCVDPKQARHETFFHDAKAPQ